MSERSDTQLTSISKARTLEEIADFWDTHSLADYWDQTHEVEFEVRARRRRRVTLDPEVYAQVEGQARARGILPETIKRAVILGILIWGQARARGILPETLVNLWLAERLAGEKVA